MDSARHNGGPTEREELKATCDVLLDLAVDPPGPDLVSAPPAVSAEAIARDLAAAGVPATTDDVLRVLNDPRLATDLSAAVLAAVRDDPGLATAVDDRVAENANDLEIGTAVLAMSALVVVALRIKEIRWGKEGGGHVRFESASTAVVEFFRGLFGGP